MSHLNEADVRSIVAMLGESISGESDFAVKRARVTEGLAELVQASKWIITRAAAQPNPLGSDLPPDFRYTVMVKGGFTDEEFVKYLETQRHPEMKVLVAPLFEACARTESRVTRERTQLHDSESMAKLDVTQKMAEVGIGPVIISQKYTSDSAFGAACFFRAEGEPEFSERDTKIAHILLSEVEWLHENSWPEYPDEKLASLPGRFTTIVNLLISGCQRKDIADKTNLSTNTISDYIKAVYKHFNVHSQAELVSRIVQGDGGDQAHAS